MIEAENASFTYQSAPSPALQDVTLTVQPGECVVLCGRSGCGKTTFTHLLNGLSPEFYPGTLTGRCTAAGLAAGEAAIEAYVPQVGSVFQNPKTQYFNVDTTAELAFPCENAGMEPQAIRRRVDEVVEQFRLGPLMDRSVFKLSGGEKQRVAFAAACMLGPRLLVLDEPTSNLDAAAIAQLHDMIAVMKRQGVTVVLAEHRLAWITDLADRYFFFAAGRLAAQWSAAEFAALPADTLAGYGLRARTLDDCRAGIRAKQSARCPGTPVLTLEGVTLGCDKKHPLRTLPDMSFAAGEIVGLMGRNGIGKSTMARTLCGLLEPVSGKICRNGRPVNARERLRSSFLVMQDVNYQLFSDSVRDEVLLGAANPERCDAVLQALGLDGLADRHPMSLSGGQKQRVVVAAAMLSDKPLILLDEPTSGLDLGSMQQVGQLLQEWKAQGKTLLVITHDEELAANWCDRVIINTTILSMTAVTFHQLFPLGSRIGMGLCIRQNRQVTVHQVDDIVREGLFPGKLCPIFQAELFGALRRTADKFTHDAPPAVLAGLYGKETREVKLIQVDFCCVSVAVNGFVWHHRDYPPCFLFVLTWIQ